jgi:hypothetical protein
VRAVIRIREGRVVARRRGWPGAVEVDVEYDGTTGVALAYPLLVGDPEPGDRVLLNTTAVDLGLGTGGYHLVVAIPDRLPPDLSPAPGHLIKARYTPLQATVLGVSEADSPFSERLASAVSVDGMPVVVADLHSALPAILAGILNARPGTKVAYVMTDGGALPLWLSRTVDALRPHLAGTVTSGQAFGGDLEAVTLHEALLAARHALGAEVTVVTQGPGNLGVGTPWGFSGVAAGDAVNAVAAVEGRAVASLRISDADPRERHRGVSHHSRTAYGRVALARAAVVVPDLPEPLASDVTRDLAESGIVSRHDIVPVESDGLLEALRRSGFPLSTMGRSLDEDASYFVAAAAAGRYAAGLL